jgi:hypothetical protein
VSAVRRLPAKLKVKSASVRNGQLRSTLSVTGRATGTLRIVYEAAGVRKTFHVSVGPSRSGEKEVKVLQDLRREQRGGSTGIMSVTYAGTAQVHADNLRSRAASLASKLKRRSLSFGGARLKVAGTISSAVSGHVRLRVTYTAAGGVLKRWLKNATIKRGRWSADSQLPTAAGKDPDAYLTMQFTGDRTAAGGPHRGEQDGKSLSNVPAR